MKDELNETQKQITSLQKQARNSEWEKLEFVEGKSINELKIKEKKLASEVSKTKKEIVSRSKAVLLTEISVLPVVFLLILISGIGPELMNGVNPEENSFKSRYFVENLRGDTLETWKSWRLVGTAMNVNIIAPGNISQEKIDVVKNSITSMEATEIDDSILNKGPKGETSLYYHGWQGATNDLANKLEKPTKYQLPLKFNIMESSVGQGDVIITLSNVKDMDGYTGYTKSVVEGNEILKSFITIYDTKNLNEDQLATITRHEFGHALGLGHSTAPEDLMAPTIDMTVPYISGCNVDALENLYNGGENDSTICEK